jgi:hypothetical protein
MLQAGSSREDNFKGFLCYLSFAVLGLYILFCVWCWRPEIGTNSVDWAQLSRFYLNTETESSPKTMDIVQKHNNCIIRTRRTE